MCSQRVSASIKKTKEHHWRNLMINYSNERNRRDLGFVWLLVGLVFLFSGFSGGTVFLLLGAVWLATSNGKGLHLFQNRPENMHALLKKITISLLVLASVILILNTIP